MKKVSPFVKFEIILPLICGLLEPLTTSTPGHGVLTFIDRFQDVAKEFSCHQWESLIIA